MARDNWGAIHHNDALSDDEIISKVEAIRFDSGSLTAERRNRRFTFIHAATFRQIACLTPVKGHDGLFDILHRSPEN